MVEYTTSLIWLAAWPLVIFLGYRFAAFNIKHFSRIEWFDAHEKGADRAEP